MLETWGDGSGLALEPRAHCHDGDGQLRDVAARDREDGEECATQRNAIQYDENCCMVRMAPEDGYSCEEAAEY